MPAQRWHLWEEGRYKDPTQGGLSDTSPSPTRNHNLRFNYLNGKRGKKKPKKAAGRASTVFSVEGFSLHSSSLRLPGSLSLLPWISPCSPSLGKKPHPDGPAVLPLLAESLACYSAPHCHRADGGMLPSASPSQRCSTAASSHAGKGDPTNGDTLGKARLARTGLHVKE